VNSERGEDDAVQQRAMGQPRTKHFVSELKSTV
jgi:hypothetical protein